MRTRITWEKHGDILVMMANGSKRGMLYWEGVWLALGIISAPWDIINTLLFTRKADAKAWLTRSYREWSGK